MLSPSFSTWRSEPFAFSGALTQLKRQVALLQKRIRPDGADQHFPFKKRTRGVHEQWNRLALAQQEMVRRVQLQRAKLE